MDNKQWFYGLNNETCGPVDWEFIIKESSEGRIDNTTLIWSEDLAEWTPLGEYIEKQKTEPSADDSSVVVISNTIAVGSDSETGSSPHLVAPMPTTQSSNSKLLRKVLLGLGTVVVAFFSLYEIFLHNGPKQVAANPHGIASASVFMSNWNNSLSEMISNVTKSNTPDAGNVIQFLDSLRIVSMAEAPKANQQDNKLKVYLLRNPDGQICGGLAVDATTGRVKRFSWQTGDQYLSAVLVLGLVVKTLHICHSNKEINGLVDEMYDKYSANCQKGEMGGARIQLDGVHIFMDMISTGAEFDY
ncbi:MAG: domain 2 [Holophagaceae bacterium]|nr:domain 2 [Holophagaceae bacterium]